MKKIFSNYSGASLEIAKQVTYSLKVLIIGLFIPFSFIFGITYNRHDEKQEPKVNIIKANKIVTENTIAWPSKALSDQNS